MKYVQNTYLSEDTWNGNFLIGFEIFITDKQGSEKTHMIPIVTGTVVSVIVITIVFVIVITVWKRRQRCCAMFHWESLLNIELKTIKKHNLYDKRNCNASLSSFFFYRCYYLIVLSAFPRHFTATFSKK